MALPALKRRGYGQLTSMWRFRTRPCFGYRVPRMSLPKSPLKSRQIV